MTAGQWPATLVLHADHLSLRGIGPWLAEVLGPERPGDVPKLAGRIELAVHEVCVNVADHAYGDQGGQVTLAARVDAEVIEVRISDHGVAFERSAVVAPQPGVPQIRGYGLMIVDQLADDVEFRRDGTANVCDLRFRRRPPEKGQG